MREILIISGKGGTGKTSLTAAFAHLAGTPVICDLDVDAPDLHLLLQPNHEKQTEFWSGHSAQIVPANCSRCGLCIEHCRFGAIETKSDGQPEVNSLKCEGCKVCVAMCPDEAVDFPAKQCGVWYMSKTRFGDLVHAQLFPAEENSGRLVALLRKEAKALAVERKADLILSDGPPGIGCPVISALSGIDLAVIVTEPTPSGLHDLERVLRLSEHFGVPASVIINKWDLHPGLSEKIKTLCLDKKIPVIASIPHDHAFTHAMVQGKTITEYENNGTTAMLDSAWRKLLKLAG